MQVNRLGAFLIHLGISLVIFIVLACIIRFVWYPDFFFAADGGWQGIRIVAAVDLVLGPLLTLIVFDRRKPELPRDLAIIATLQLSCLVAGTYVVYAERPLALVYADGHFYTMSAGSYSELGLEVPDLSVFPGPSPKRIVVQIPEDVFESSAIRRQAWQKGIPLRAMASLYQPLTFDKLNADREAQPASWAKVWEQKTGDISAWLNAHGGTLDDYAFFRLGARYDYRIVGLARSSGLIIGMLDTPLSTLAADAGGNNAAPGGSAQEP